MRTVIAIALGAALGAGGFALAQHDKHGDVAKVKSLLEQDVSKRIDGKEARVSAIEVSYGPWDFTPPHRHPGAVFGHVLGPEAPLSYSVWTAAAGAFLLAQDRPAACQEPPVAA